MATPELAIAKAALSASLFRADPTSTSRPSVDSFFQLLNSTLAQCSRPNVQNCKDYITSNIALSSGRTTSLAKYLVALSKAQVDNDGNAPRPSSKRRRLHILYIANDALHHEQSHRNFSSAWEPFLPALFTSAAAYDKCPKHIRKLEDLITLWQERQYVSDDAVTKLKEALSNGGAPPPASAPDPTTSSSTLKLAREAPYVLPSFHGDASTAWYDLPAATWLPHLVPNSTKPMLPELIKPLQLAPGPADKAITSAVKALLSDAERIFAKENLPEDDGFVDINELGERIILDENTGDIISGETYYGWSRRFCERMKDRKNRGHARGRSYSRSQSRSRSSSRDRSYSRSRRRSSSSRSTKRRRISPSSRSRSRSHSRISPSSRSRGRSRSRSRSRSHSYTPSRSRSRDRVSRSPTRQPPNLPHPPHPPHPPPNMPIPPPPSGYKGPWPPPPPPPPHLSGPHSGWMPDPAFAAQIMGAWNPGQAPPLHPPPPPPPPPPQLQHQLHYDNYDNRVLESGGYRGRGGGGGRGYYRGARGARGAGRFGRGR